LFNGNLMLRQPATQMFLRELGIEADPTQEMDDFLLACEQANPRYQGGVDRVRFQLEEDDSTWPEGIKQVTLNMAGALGMLRGETPLRKVHDLIIALGGARRSPLHRAMYAAQAVIDGRADTKLLIIAGSTRQLGKKEIPEVQDFAPRAETEFDLCEGAMRTILERYPGLRIATVCNDDPKSGNDGVIDAVMRSEIVTSIGETELRVAAVTTQIYVAGLDFDMARAAKRHSWDSYLSAGHSSDPEMVFKRKLATYLSECLTILRKAAIAAAERC